MTAYNDDYVTSKKYQTIYIAGPMTGVEDFNRPAFEEASARFREAGWSVISPIEMDDENGGPGSEPWEVVLRRDLKALIQKCDAIAMLPGWTDSRGATLEYNTARTLGLEVYNAQTMMILPGQQEPAPGDSICAEAQALVFGDRRFAYGHPLDNFGAVLSFWKAHLGTMLMYKTDLPSSIIKAVLDVLTEEDVALMMIETKVARQLNASKRDNFTDIAGYAEAGYQAGVERSKRDKAFSMLDPFALF